MHLGKEKPNGSGVYWQGLDMASSSPLSVDIENDKLYSVYASHWMYDIITEYISEPYLPNLCCNLIAAFTFPTPVYNTS